MAILVFLFLIFIFNLIYFFKIKSISNSKLKLDYYREIPSNESPAIVGYMIKGNCDGNDVVATLLDLNYRGYINIQYELIDGVEKSVISLTDKDRFMVLKDFENFLLDELFKNNEKVILDDYFSSHQFQEIFNPFGNMIKKRVGLQSTHKISIKKNISKISFITHFVSLGFSISFPLLFLILRKSIDVIYIIGISFIINFCFFIQILHSLNKVLYFPFVSTLAVEQSFESVSPFQVKSPVLNVASSSVNTSFTICPRSSFSVVIVGLYSIDAPPLIQPARFSSIIIALISSSNSGSVPLNSSMNTSPLPIVTFSFDPFIFLHPFYE